MYSRQGKNKLPLKRKKSDLQFVPLPTEESDEYLYLFKHKMDSEYKLTKRKSIIDFLKINKKSDVSKYTNIIKKFSKKNSNLEIILIIPEQDLLFAKKSKTKVFLYSISSMKKIKKINPQVREIKDVIQLQSYLVFAGLNGVFRQFDLNTKQFMLCLLYTSPSPRDLSTSRMPSSA